MAKIPYMPLFVEPFLADTRHLTYPELGIYTAMLLTMWCAPKQRFPNDMSWLARKFRMTPEEAEHALRPIMEEFFDCSQNWISHTRLSKEFDRVTASITKQSARAKARWNGSEGHENPSRVGGHLRVTRGEDDSAPDNSMKVNGFDACRGIADPAMPSTSTSTLRKKEPPIPPATAKPGIAPDGAAAAGAAILDQGFAELWKDYPRKVGKRQAAKAYAAALGRKVQPETIAQGLAAAVQKWGADKTETKFIPHPATWLNADRWADEPPAKAYSDWRLDPKQMHVPG